MPNKENRPARVPATRAKSRLGVARKSSGATSRPQFPVVGIGASAGGLEACTALLKALPVNPGMAFVVVQHLDPHHESILHKLLSKATEMPVIQVEDGMALEPDHVYVIPPKHDIAVREKTLRLLSRRRTGGRHLPINRFFASLAEDQKSAAIGVVLSGTASDGTVGLQAIKSEGGVAFAQDPKSAGYPGMPESAILAGCVDFVLPPEEIARELVRLKHLPDAKTSATVLEAVPPLESAADLQKIIHILRAATGVDFSLYKTGTIKRRVARRMILHKIERLHTLRIAPGAGPRRGSGALPGHFYSRNQFLPRTGDVRGAATKGPPYADRESAERRTASHMGPRMLHGRGGVLDRHNDSGVSGQTGPRGRYPGFWHRHQCAGG